MKHYDAIIIGGGTAGCAATYTAGMAGLKVLLIEKNIHLGGTITSALVVPAMKCGEHQINTEFYEALVAELNSIGGQATYLDNQGWFNPELTKIALDNLMLKAGVEVFFDTHIQDVCIKDRRIESIKISKEILSVYNDKIQKDNKLLSECIGAKYFVDATGNCEFGKLCNCEFLEEKMCIRDSTGTISKIPVINPKSNGYSTPSIIKTTICIIPIAAIDLSLIHILNKKTPAQVKAGVFIIQIISICSEQKLC